MENDFEKFYDDAIRIWGEEAQIRMCIEEMSELTKELCKYERYVSAPKQYSKEQVDEVKEHTAEEIADVLNCVSQMARIFGQTKVDKVRNDKKDRTFKRLETYKQLLGVKNTTLLYIVKDGKVLLGKKLRGFGKGFYNGAGGKVQPNETIEEAMLRETHEEFGIVPKNYKYVGNIFYDEFKGDEKIYYDTHIFVADDFDGEPCKSDEMEPEWFDINNLPYENMFGDDVYWLKEVLCGKRINARFEFDKDFKISSREIYLKD